MFHSFTKIVALVCQSVVLGYLSDYFSLDEPTPENNRDAYLYAAGEWWSSTSTLRKKM